MIKSETCFNRLPENIINSLKTANVFYSKDYFYFKKNSFSSPIYLFDNNIIMLIIINTKYIFKFADIPIEPFVYNLIDSNMHQYLDESIKYLKEKYKIQWVNPTYASAVFSDYPSNSRRIKFGTYLICLEEEEDILWGKIHGKHKNSLRKAQKSGIIIKFGGIELLDNYLALDEQTWERNGRRSNGRYFFEDFVHKLNNNVLICLALKENIPQGGAIILFNQQCGYYLYGATKNNPDSGAMNLLHWHVMIHLKNIGTKYYNMVGARINVDKNSKYYNIQRFKERFGGELQVGYMFKVINNKLAYKMFQFLLQIKTGSKIIDPIEQEISKWDELNY